MIVLTFFQPIVSKGYMREKCTKSEEWENSKLGTRSSLKRPHSRRAEYFCSRVRD